MRATKQVVPKGILVFTAELSPSGFFAFEVDFAVSFDWFLFTLVNAPSRDDFYHVGGLRCEKWGGFAKRLLMQFLCGQISKYRRTDKIGDFQIFAEEADSVRLNMSRLFGPRRAARFFHAVEALDWNWFSANQRKYQLAFIARHLCLNPVRIVPAAVRRLRLKRALDDAPKVSPDVYFRSAGRDDLSPYWKRFEQTLTERYVFHSVSYHDVADANELQSIQKQVLSAQRSLSLHCFPYFEGFAEDGGAVVIDMARTTPESAAVQVAAKHFDMLDGVLSAPSA
jgi:hypothetical protein